MKRKTLALAIVSALTAGCLFACDKKDDSSSNGENPTTHEHSWDEGTELEGATCTQKGTMQYTCACGETKTEDIPTLPHRYDTESVEWKWSGYKSASVSVLCLECERAYSFEATVEAEEIDKGSCEEDGKMQHTAIVTIGKEVVVDVLEEVVEASGHSYDESGKCNCGARLASVGLEYELNADEKSYSVVGKGECEDTVLRIPSQYENLPVTAIAPSAFYEDADITEVIIAEGLKEIGDWAFMGCYKMKKIRIPSTIEHIGESAFKQGISGSNSHNTYNGVKYLGNEENPYLVAKSVSSSNQYDENISLHEDTKIILDHAFENCSVKTVTFPSSLVEIGKYAYYKCNKLQTLVIPANVLRVGWGAFYQSGIQTVKVEGKDTVFGKEVFYGCSRLTDLEMPFAGLSKDTGTMIRLFDDGATTEGAYPNSLKNIVINHNVIPSGAFFNLTSVESIKIRSEEPTTLGDTPFGLCRALKTVELPSTLVSVAGGLFQDCSAIVPHVKNGGYYLGNDENPYVLLYDVEDDKITDFTVEENTKVIAGAFDGCYSLQSVRLPKGLQQIGKKSFHNCRVLSTVDIPDEVASIGDYAFHWCDSLANITIPKGVTTIGVCAFDCNELTTVYYKGTASDWAKISIGDGNSDLANATRYYYIEKEEDVPTDGWYYWHYDGQGNIVVWKKEN